MMTALKNKLACIDKTTKSAFISMAIKPLNMLLGLIYTPLLLSYLGDEYYGLWVTILSIVSWINFFDVGIGHGLRNELAGLLSSKEKKDEEIKDYVSTAYIVLTCIAAFILLVLVVLTYSLDWKNIFSTNVEMRLPLLISFIFICINFVLALSNSILYAMQKAELVSLVTVYSQIINILGILILRQIGRGNLVYISILIGASTTIVSVFNTIRIGIINKNLVPSYSRYSKKCVTAVSNVGIKFFIIQIMCLAMFTVDNMLITHFFGATEVTPFSIVEKLFNTAYSVWVAFLVPYWSGTTAAISNGDIAWIKNSIKKTSIFLLLFICGYVLLAFIFKPLAAIWLHRELDYQHGIIWVMCIFYILNSILALECQFINGSGKINTQLYLYIILGVANIPLSIYLGVGLGMKAVGIRLATTILIFIMDIVLAFNLKKIIKKL